MVVQLFNLCTEYKFPAVSCIIFIMLYLVCRHFQYVYFSLTRSRFQFYFQIWQKTLCPPIAVGHIVMSISKCFLLCKFCDCEVRIVRLAMSLYITCHDVTLYGYSYNINMTLHLRISSSTCTKEQFNNAEHSFKYNNTYTANRNPPPMQQWNVQNRSFLNTFFNGQYAPTSDLSVMTKGVKLHKVVYQILLTASIWKGCSGSFVKKIEKEGQARSKKRWTSKNFDYILCKFFSSIQDYTEQEIHFLFKSCIELKV